MLLICFERVVTTAPANDPMITGLLSIEMELNSNIIVPPMNTEQFTNVVRNLEQYQIATISNGLIHPKVFSPPIKQNTTVSLQLTVDTLALTFAAAATAACDLVIIAVDRKNDDLPASNLARYIRSLPPTLNVAVNAPQEIKIGTDPRLVQDYVLNELTAAAYSDTWLAEVELIANSQRVMKLGAAPLKEAYRSESNQAVPAGYLLYKPPSGIDPSKYTTIVLSFDSHTATPLAALGGWERYWKAY